jgi:tetratricopeptide (TPR) repeat protein
MVVAPDAPLNEALARQVAEREGMKAVLAGEVSSVGSGYMLSARLLSPVDGTLLAAERVTADDDTELIAAMDQLSARLRERIGESLKDVRASPPLDRVTTSSLEALRKFTQAVHLDEQKGDPAGALPLLEDAVALDTTFAMAYRKLGNIVGGLRGADESRTAVRRAFELRDRLPERERYLIEAYYYSQGGLDFDGAKLTAAYRSALMLDPDDYIALNNLSHNLNATRQWAEAESLALRAVEVSGIWQAYVSAFEAQLPQGKFAEAQATIDRYAESNPGHPRATDWQARVAIAKREYDLAEQVLLEGVSNPNLPLTQRGTVMHWLGDLLRLRGRVAEARQWYRDWMTFDYGSMFDFQATYHVASLEVEYGSHIEALRLLDSFRVDSLSPVQPPHLLLAELFASAGQVDRAKALFAEFEKRVDAGVRRFPTYQQASRQIAGEIALREDRFDDAAIDFNAAYELAGQCMTCGLSRLAYSLEHSGRQDSALAVYQLLAAATVQLDEVQAHLGAGIRSLRGLPESYRRLGELYEARNDTTNAVRHYNEFIELWRDADPELQPLVEDIRRRIGTLTRER